MGLTRVRSAPIAQLNCTVAGNVRFSILEAGLNAPGLSRRASRKRTPETNAPFSPRERRLKGKLLHQSLLTPEPLLKISSENNCWSDLPSESRTGRQVLPAAPWVSSNLSEYLLACGLRDGYHSGVLDPSFHGNGIEAGADAAGAPDHPEAVLAHF
jgi:hypothetical protein